MATVFDSLAALYAAGFDDIIDVRSPAEYKQDHIPGAISLPAMTNDERARVGTIYTQDSPFNARKIGAAIVARNVAQHLDGPLANRDGAWQPLVYCWRGGQRSGSFATILEQIGWRTSVLGGGYQSYRRMVAALLHDQPIAHKLILLDGNTGTGKTEILKLLAQRDVQFIDLEGLANHRGSLLGRMPSDQPAQKAFESALACALTGLDPNKPTLVEAESSKIGKLLIPPSLWQAMCAAPRIRVSAPLAARATYLTQAYGDLLQDRQHLCETLAPLAAYHGHERIAQWQFMAQNGQFTPLASELMADHYDPRYARSQTKHNHTQLVHIQLQSLDSAARAQAADQIAACAKTAP